MNDDVIKQHIKNINLIKDNKDIMSLLRHYIKQHNKDCILYIIATTGLCLNDTNLDIITYMHSIGVILNHHFSVCENKAGALCFSYLMSKNIFLTERYYDLHKNLEIFTKHSNTGHELSNLSLINGRLDCAKYASNLKLFMRHNCIKLNIREHVDCATYFYQLAAIYGINTYSILSENF